MAYFYKQILLFIRTYHLDKIIIPISKIAPYLTAILYAGTLLYLAIYQQDRLFITIIKPLSAFLIVTIIRKMINRPRPCITMQIEPLVGHKTEESFPSRHTVSAFSIAFALLLIDSTLGYLALSIAVIVALTRILCGVHHISDVLVAIMISLIIAII